MSWLPPCALQPGASAALLMAAREERITLLGNVAQALEYEAARGLAEHVRAAGLYPGDAVIFVEAVIATLERVESHFMWRPRLRDPADEMVLEAAVNGHADAIVTFNRRGFGAAPNQLGVSVLAPGEALRKIRT
jgi:predicted nucleic acid-binding protein